MLLWAALKATVHATIQLKLVFSFFLCFFGMCVLVWFGFVSGFPKMNPLPCEKEELYEAQPLHLWVSSAPYEPPPATLLLYSHGSADHSQRSFSGAESWISPGCFQLVCITSIHRSFLFTITQARQHLSAGRAARSHPRITGKTQGIVIKG